MPFPFFQGCETMPNPWLSTAPYTIFDLETTGMSPVHDRIVEIGAVRIETNGSMTFYESLVNPEIPIPTRVTAIHGISDQMVADSPRFDIVSHEFTAFADGSKLVAHNARFDLAFLQESLNRCGRTTWSSGAYDSIALTRKAYPGLPSYSLGALRKHFSLGEEIEGQAHRALYDARITAELFFIVMDRLYEMYEK